MIRSIFILLFLTLNLVHCLAQGTLADYQRTEAAVKNYRNKVYNDPREFHWLEGNGLLWYKNVSRNGSEFILVDVGKKTQKPAFDHVRVAKSLSLKLKKKIEPGKLPFEQIEFSKDMKSISFQADSAKFKCLLSSYDCQVTEIVKPEKRNEEYWGNAFNESGNKPVKSADSLWIGFVKNNNVYVSNRKTKAEFQLSYDGAAGNFYSSYMQWSPDSKKLMAYKITPGEKHLIYFVESSPKDQLQPRLCTREYLKPGDVVPQKQPQLFLIDEKKHVPVSDERFNQQYSLEGFEW